MLSAEIFTQHTIKALKHCKVWSGYKDADAELALCSPHVP